MEFHGGWTAAMAETIEKWRRIRDTIQTSAPVDLADVDLMAEVGSVCALCDRSREEAHLHEEWRPCPFCPAFQQLGGCMDLPGRLSEALAAKDQATALRLTEQILADLETLEVPQAS